MDNKGFTLVELIAVLGLVFTIMVLSMLGLM